MNIVTAVAQVLVTAADVLAVAFGLTFVLMVAWITFCEWSVRRARRRRERVWKRIAAETTDLHRELDEAEWSDAVCVVQAKDRVS